MGENSLLKAVNNRSSIRRCETCSKLTIKKPEQLWTYSTLFFTIVDFNDVFFYVDVMAQVVLSLEMWKELQKISGLHQKSNRKSQNTFSEHLLFK